MTELKILTDSPETAAIIISILMEVDRAEKKHPTWPGCHVKQIAFVAEEAGELVRAGNLLDESKGTFIEIKEEAMQVAATAIRLLKKLPETEKAYTQDGIIEYFGIDKAPGEVTEDGLLVIDWDRINLVGDGSNRITIDWTCPECKFSRNFLTTKKTNEPITVFCEGCDDAFCLKIVKEVPNA